MERWRGRVALVTGASTGIGAAICRQLVKHGMTVVGCARRHKPIEDMAAELKDSPGSLTAIRCDLAQSDQIEAMFHIISERFGGVHVCVNNAALYFRGSLLDGDIQNWRTTLEVNVLALAHCTQLAIRSMRERNVGEGMIININSLSGHAVDPSCTDLHFYAASKFAVTGLTEALRAELQATRIRVGQICPGLVNTDMATSLLPDKLEMVAAGLQSDDVADVVTYMLSTPSHVQIRDVHMEPCQPTTSTENN